jgi:transcriptional regulator with GAF, ATPase, and Fis domain
MLRLAVTVVLAILGIFVHPFDPGMIDFTYRFLIFSSIIYLAYLNLRNVGNKSDVYEQPPEVLLHTNKELEVETKREWKLGDLISKDERTLAFISDQFEVMGNLLMPDNGWIFARNASDSLDKIRHENFSGHGTPIESEHFPINGILQILNNSDTVVIENNIESQSQLLALYQEGNYRVSSFLGIPLFLPNEQKIYFCFDSSAKDHFNQEDAKVIHKIVKGIETFLLNRLKAYSLLTEASELKDLLSFTQIINGCKTIGIATERFIDWIAKRFEASRLTVSIVKKETGKAVIKKVIGQMDEFEENTEFAVDEGLTGWVIGKCKPYLIDDIEKGEYFIPRYTKEEKSNYGMHSFLGVPLISGDQVYGALTLEHVVPGRYTESDKKMILQLAEIFSTVFNRQVI